MSRGRRRALLLLLLLLIAATFWVYLNYFNVALGGLDYKGAAGPLFFFPMILLTLGQVSPSAIIIHLSAKLALRERAELTVSFLISAVLTFLFSLFYVIFPVTGPFYYVTFVVEEVPARFLMIEVLWTVVLIAVGTIMIKLALKARWHRALGLAGMLVLILMVTAS